MADITASSTAEIDAPLDQVWAVVEDVEDAPNWQGGLKAMRPLERDGDGHATLCEADSDAKVRTLTSVIRFSYDGPGRLSWRQERGDLKSVEGYWALEALDDGHTRATYSVDVEFGRILGMLIRGPLVDLLRHELADARARELKGRVERSR